MRRMVLGTVLVAATLASVPAEALMLLVQGSGGGARTEKPAPPTPPAPPVPPEPDAGPRLKGQLRTGLPSVSLDANEERVGDILWEIAEQAGLDLLVSAPRTFLRQRLTIRLNDRPVGQALEAVLSTTQLEAEARGNMITVRARPGAMPDVEAIMERVRTNVGKRPNVGDPELVVFGQPLEVALGETVAEAVVVGGPLTVRGHVTGDAVAIGGPVLVESEAIVDGDVVSLGGPIEVREGAIVKGDKVALSGPIGNLGGLIASASHGDLPDFFDFFGIAWTVVRFLTLFVLALLLMSFVPERVKRVRTFLVARPGASAAAGFAMLIGIGPLSILLLITIIGIPLVFVAFFLLASFMVMGITAFMLLLGERLPILQGRKTPLLAMLMGLGLVILIDFLPFVGTLLVFIVSFIAGGAALLSRFGGEPKVPPTVAATVATAES